MSLLYFQLCAVAAVCLLTPPNCKPRMGIVSGRSGVWTPLRARFADPSILVPRPARLLVQCVPCIFLVVKEPGRGADHPPPFRGDGWSARAIPLSSPLSLLGIMHQPLPFMCLRVMPHTGVPSLCRRCISLLDKWSCSAAPVVFLRHVRSELCFLKGRMSCNWNEAWSSNCLWCKFGGKRSCDEKLRNCFV